MGGACDHIKAFWTPPLPTSKEVKGYWANMHVHVPQAHRMSYIYISPRLMSPGWVDRECIVRTIKFKPLF